MNLIKVVLVEDEPIIAADLSCLLKKNNVEVIDIFEDGISVLSYLEHNHPDLILMDVQLYGDLDGIDVANRISGLYSIPIIFLTSNTDTKTFNRAKLSTPHAFLSKPFRIRDVMHAIHLAMESHDPTDLEYSEQLDDRIFIRNNEALDKVMYQDILYLKADGAYTHIVTRDKEYIVSQTLKKVEGRIKNRDIFRIHRSYVVNIKKIDKITDGSVHIYSTKIPVSRSYREFLLSRLGQTI